MKKLVPNSITAANMLCGFYSIVCSIHGQAAQAAWWIIAASVFDLFDGRIARLLGATSEFGEHFDTLSDLLSFGAAPAVLYGQTALGDAASAWGWAIPFVYLICVAFRLARFSVKTVSAAKGCFQGLSSPVSAATSATLVLFLNGTAWDPGRKSMVLVSSAVVLGGLMVSHLKFPTFKEMNWRSPAGYACLAIFAAALALCLTHPSAFLFPAFSVFIGGVLVWNGMERLGERTTDV